jgi:hypothetical protein
VSSPTHPGTTASRVLRTASSRTSSASTRSPSGSSASCALRFASPYSPSSSSLPSGSTGASVAGVSSTAAAQPLRVEVLFLHHVRVPERAHQRAQPRQVGGRGPSPRRGRRAARQLELPAVLHAITVIDHDHQERHGKGGACSGYAGFERERSDSTVESLQRPRPRRYCAFC